ncbi:MAG: sulfurtransferase TusA family protein [Alphaproteobacteria bacterium]|nr:sulfurtransferase TusA family protein [Alphaproteobacteria bacterium]MDG1885618.1 sulfurtransferase TusA family protein [Alphaproteobacteria bacterium]|tara:strand:+ start:111 stop:347 length:237 start_codon:yes stop_codon:yes gene_type:complete
MNNDIILVDATGLKCPLPVLKARKAMKDLSAGSQIRILSTDPASPLDFKHFCNSKGHKLIAMQEREHDIEFLIEKGPE